MLTRIDQVLSRHRVVITVGAGGVGKTTLAAAVGLEEALSGRRVMVVTIDPARRLATALGLSDIGGQPRSVDISSLGGQGQGGMDIMMLDPRQVFTDMITRNTQDPQRVSRVLENPFFKLFARAMGGTQEHAAVEQLLQLLEAGRYDLIVLDTPPSRHALDFLTSPTRLMNWLDDTVLKWVAAPAGGSLTLFSFGSRYIGKVISHFTGGESLADVATFISLAAEDFRYLRTRAVKVHQVLHQDDTLYLVVGSPERHGLEGALMFERALKKDGFQVGAYVLNRVETAPDRMATAALLDGLSQGESAGLIDDLTTLLSRHERQAKAHEAKVAELVEAVKGHRPVFVVPAYRQEIVTIHSVRDVARRLFAAPARYAQPQGGDIPPPPEDHP